VPVRICKYQVLYEYTIDQLAPPLVQRPAVTQVQGHSFIY